jgi:nucleotide-binding universal stress UspA family protein
MGAVDHGETEVELGPIIVATDGTPSCDAALRAAALIAGISTTVVVVSAVEPLAVAGFAYGVMLQQPRLVSAQRDAQLAAVRQQLSRVGGTAPQWTVDVQDGTPPHVIARAAREWRAQLVIMGIGHHDLLVRLGGMETTLQTLRATSTPVLAVPQTFAALPTRAVLATDFSVASIDAAQAALRRFPSITTVNLVHVMPRVDMEPEVYAAWTALYGEGLTPLFDRAKGELGLPATTAVETTTLEGKSSREILRLAASAHADLIVTGSRGSGFIDRLLVGSTATGLIRGAQCAVLAVPARTGSERSIAASADASASMAENHWAAELSSFTKRNAGRRTTLEVDDPEFGAQAQEHDYPLLGVAYDHNDRRVEIMLGDNAGRRPHLTRGIEQVRSIDVLRDAAGRDRALRIAHGEGQTILTLES